MDHPLLTKPLQATALYRGMSSPLVGVAAINAVTFGVHGNVSRRLANPDSMKSQVIAGLTAGLAQVGVMIMHGVS